MKYVVMMHGSYCMQDVLTTIRPGLEYYTISPFTEVHAFTQLFKFLGVLGVVSSKWQCIFKAAGDMPSCPTSILMQ